MLSMQMTELWRRGVVRPHSVDVACDMRAARVDENTPVDYLPIDNSLFANLIDVGLFSDLNGACGTLISDYEEEELPFDALKACVGIIECPETADRPPDMRNFLQSLALLEHTASDTGTPLIFIL
jgi:hypothetical protein